MIETSALERVVDLAGAVRGDDHDGRMRRLHRAELRDGDLKVGEHFQEERLERLVGAVELVDQEDRRAGGSASSACSSDRLIRKRSEKTSCSSRSRSCAPSASATRIAIICAA